MRRILFLAGLLLSPAVASGQCNFFEDLLIQGPPAASTVGLGTNLAMDGAVLVSGTPFDPDQGTIAGAVHVFRRQGGIWQHEQKLYSSTPQPYDWFGFDVAVQGDRIAVGVPFDEALGLNAGAVFLFRHDGVQWQEELKLTAFDGSIGDNFGSAVDLDGNRLAVGAKRDLAGAVYTYLYDGMNWNLEQKLKPLGGQFGNVGESLDLDGSRLLIGAPWYNAGGVAFVYDHDGVQWNQSMLLTVSDVQQDDAVGTAVALSGSLVVLGAPMSDTSGSDSGAAYVFEESGGVWSEVQKLAGSATADRTETGSAVRILNGRIFVGSPRALYGDGAVEVYRHDGVRWIEERVLTSAWPGSPRVGTDLVVQDSQVLAGASNAITAAGSGMVLGFDLTDLALKASSPNVGPGNSLSLDVCGGRRTELVLLTADVNGGPGLYRVALGSFRGKGRYTLTATVPPGLSGVGVRFLAVGFITPTSVGSSNVESVWFR